MKNIDTVNIIGGGIAGLTTALALKAKGIKYNLFEQNPEITYQNVALGISANIRHILEEWNILEETKQLGTEIYDFHLVDNNLNYIKSFKLKRPALSVNRRQFHKLLYSRLDVEHVYLNTKKSIHDFPENELVISADGINSKFRQEIYPNLKLRDSNQILFRGISEITLDEKFKNSYHDFVGQNLRFAIIHIGGNYYAWYIIKEKKQSEKVSPDKTVLKSYFKGYHSIVQKVIDHSENIYPAELLDINPKKRKNLDWFSKNTLLIGDAIHPTTPNMANGACLAMEDSYLLAGLLSNENLTLPETFELFQKRRTSKIDPIVFHSWWFGKLMHQKNKVIDHVVKIGMAFTPKLLFDGIYSRVLIETKIEKTS
ncbi:MAG: FAD-dependent monooxygenase [Bacteroidota bacterium]